MKKCTRCGTSADDTNNFCPNCGSPLSSSDYYRQPPNYHGNTYYGNSSGGYNNPFDASGPEGKSRGVCALLAIFLGGLGIQYFYLGKVSAGILCILITVCTCGIWKLIMLVQGILMLAAMTNDQFQQKFVNRNTSFPIF